MIVVDTLAEMRKVLPSCACIEMAALVEELAENEAADAVGFTDLFGGPVCIVETLSELGLIASAEELPNRRASLLDCATAAFDVAEWVCDEAFARFLLIDNDLGGTQYFVPHHIAAQCCNVGNSIRLFLAP